VNKRILENERITTHDVTNMFGNFIWVNSEHSDRHINQVLDFCQIHALPAEIGAGQLCQHASEPSRQA
jgi:hypothetical protein